MGSLGYKETYKYDDNKNLIEKNVYKSDGIINYKSSYEYKYDKNDNWIKKIEFKDDIPQDITVREIEYY